jgi:hypothetical protein
MGEGRYIPPFLISALDGGEWSVSLPGRFTPWEPALGIHWIRGWLGPRACLHGCIEKNHLPCRESDPGLSARCPSLYRVSYFVTIRPHTCIFEKRLENKHTYDTQKCAWMVTYVVEVTVLSLIPQWFPENTASLITGRWEYLDVRYRK